MQIKLNHVFLNRCWDINWLLNNCDKLSTFISRLKRQSEKNPNLYSPENYLGDGFEMFVEALIKLSPIDNRIGIGQYEPINEDEDTGVDGYGIGLDGNKASVQIKFRTNHKQFLTANEDHLSNFVSTSLLSGVSSESDNNMLIVTTAAGLNFYTDNQMFQNKVRCIGYKQLQNLVDGNKLFWNSFRNLTNNQNQ